MTSIALNFTEKCKRMKVRSSWLSKIDLTAICYLTAVVLRLLSFCIAHEGTLVT